MTEKARERREIDGKEMTEEVRERERTKESIKTRQDKRNKWKRDDCGGEREREREKEEENGKEMTEIRQSAEAGCRSGSYVPALHRIIAADWSRNRQHAA